MDRYHLDLELRESLFFLSTSAADADIAYISRSGSSLSTLSSSESGLESRRTTTGETSMFFIFLLFPLVLPLPLFFDLLANQLSPLSFRNGPKPVDMTVTRTQSRHESLYSNRVSFLKRAQQSVGLGGKKVNSNLIPLSFTAPFVVADFQFSIFQCRTPSSSDSHLARLPNLVPLFVLNCLDQRCSLFLCFLSSTRLPHYPLRFFPPIIVARTPSHFYSLLPACDFVYSTCLYNHSRNKVLRSGPNHNHSLRRCERLRDSLRVIRRFVASDAKFRFRSQIVHLPLDRAFRQHASNSTNSQTILTQWTTPISDSKHPSPSINSPNFLVILLFSLSYSRSSSQLDTCSRSQCTACTVWITRSERVGGGR